MKRINYLQALWLLNIYPDTPCRAHSDEGFIPSEPDTTFRKIGVVYPSLYYWIGEDSYKAVPEEVRALADSNTDSSILREQVLEDRAKSEPKPNFSSVQIFQVPVLLAKTNKIISILVMAETLDEAKKSVLSVHGKDIQRLVE